MNPDEENTTASGEDSRAPACATTPSGRAKARLTLLSVVAMCALPLLVALYFRYVSPPEVAATVGVPLDPVPLPFELLQLSDGARLAHAAVGEKWLVIFAAPGACDARCQQTLYLTRQARTAQGRNMDRIDRVWVITDGAVPPVGLLAAHPDLLVARATDRKLLDVLGGSESRHINLVDRRGLVVFRYSDSPEPKAFIRELGKLVRL